MAAVDLAAEDEWKAYADLAIGTLARRQTAFTTDDVWAELRRVRAPRPREPRALGPRMMVAATHKLITKAPGQEKTQRPVAHSRPLQVWKSLVYRQP